MDNKTILDVLTARPYHKHIEIFEAYFGYHFKGHYKASWHPKETNSWMIWFPKMLKNRDGSPKDSDGWINTISDDDEEIHEYMIDSEKDIEYSDKVYRTNPDRLVFAFNQNDSKYYFKGVYKTDLEKSTESNHYFKRISKQVELIGAPVTNIKINVQTKVNPGLEEILSFYKKNYEVITGNEIYKWEAAKLFRDSHIFDVIGTDDDAFMTKMCAFLKKMDNLLNGGQYFKGRNAVEKCLKVSTIKTRKAFLELYNTEKEGIDLIERMNSFNNSMSEILANINADNGERKAFNDGYRVASLFLYYMFPTKYYIYKYGETEEVRKRIGFKSLGTSQEEKILNAYEMYKYILDYVRNDSELMELHAARQSLYREYDPELHLLVQTVIWSIKYTQEYCDGFTSKYKCREIQNPKDITKDIKVELTHADRKKKDYLSLASSNKLLGGEGERFVYNSELVKCRNLFPKDEAKRPILVSEKTDSRGYDIESYDESGDKIYIEVKTTSGPYETEFYFSEYELAVSEQLADRYYLYRVYNFTNGMGDISITVGSLKQFANHPASYRISLSE